MEDKELTELTVKTYDPGFDTPCPGMLRVTITLAEYRHLVTRLAELNGEVEKARAKRDDYAVECYALRTENNSMQCEIEELREQLRAVHEALVSDGEA